MNQIMATYIKSHVKGRRSQYLNPEVLRLRSSFTTACAVIALIETGFHLLAIGPPCENRGERLYMLPGNPALERTGSGRPIGPAGRVWL